MRKKSVKPTKPTTTYNSWAVYLKLLKSAAPYWLFFVIGITGTVLAAGTDAVLTWLLKPLIGQLESWMGVNFGGLVGCH